MDWDILFVYDSGVGVYEEWLEAELEVDRWLERPRGRGLKAAHCDAPPLAVPAGSEFTLTALEAEGRNRRRAARLVREARRAAEIAWQEAQSPPEPQEPAPAPPAPPEPEPRQHQETPQELVRRLERQHAHHLERQRTLVAEWEHELRDGPREPYPPGSRRTLALTKVLEVIRAQGLAHGRQIPLKHYEANWGIPDSNVHGFLAFIDPQGHMWQL